MGTRLTQEAVDGSAIVHLHLEQAVACEALDATTTAGFEETLAKVRAESDASPTD